MFDAMHLWFVAVLLLLVGFKPAIASPDFPDIEEQAMLANLEHAIRQQDATELMRYIHPASYYGPVQPSQRAIEDYLAPFSEVISGVHGRLHLIPLASYELDFVDRSSEVHAYFNAGAILLLGDKPDYYGRLMFGPAGESSQIGLLPIKWHDGLSKIMVPVAGRILLDPEVDVWRARVKRLRAGESVSGLMPIAVHKPFPKFPPHLLSSGQNGCAEVQFGLDEQGNTINVRAVEYYPDASFADAAVSEAEQWRFLPHNSKREAVQRISFVAPGTNPMDTPGWRKHCAQGQDYSSFDQNAKEH